MAGIAGKHKGDRYVADFRSDTVTRPSSAMRRAMAAAEVGDDVFADDPTVNDLEQRAAKLLGKPAALFVTSGSMGNLLAIAGHTRPGDEIVVGAGSHIQRWEGASAGQVAAVNKQVLVENPDGSLPPEKIAAAVQVDDVHLARTALVCWEITHNTNGAVIPDWATVQAGVRVARKCGLKTHLDGARLFNAVAETGISAARYSGLFDSVTFCLSKNLGAPVGSILAGTKAFIHDARRLRKMLGGGWRQAGILAAAGVYALEHNLGRLQDDHRLARRLARDLCAVPGFSLARTPVATNMVYAGYADPRNRAHDHVWMAAQLNRRGIGCLADAGAIRFVTHLDVNDTSVNRLVQAARTIVGRR